VNFSFRVYKYKINTTCCCGAVQAIATRIDTVEFRNYLYIISDILRRLNSS